MSALGATTLASELVPGSVEAAYELARLGGQRSSVADDISHSFRRQHEIDGWTGSASDAYGARIDLIARRWELIGEALEALVEPMQTYGRALSRAQGLAQDAIEAWAYASSLPTDGGEPPAFRSFASGWPLVISDARHQGAAPSSRAEALRRAEAMLADACADVLAAGDIAAAAVRALIEPLRARGEVWVSIGEGLGRTAVPSAHMLSVMSALDSSALTALLRARPDLVVRLAQADPAAIAPWWRDLDPDVREVLITEAPGVIGNLGGVAYASRDRANRIVLAQALQDARNSPWDQSDQVAALEALGRAATGNTLASLVLDRPPLAQVAVGDLDRAHHISVIVPGMGTTVGGDMEAYAEVADALAGQQARLSGVGRDDLGVIAWIGYHPPMPDSHALEVISDDRASVGARSLAYDLESLRVTAGNGSLVELSVIAHSYGTDVATLALQQAEADHLVMLGSAGISGEVGDASTLNVPEGQVFSSQSRRDEWAPIGQVLSGRTDPTSGGFGASVFSSESAVVEGKELLAVSKHGPIGAETAADASYFTSNTTSMYNTALATMGNDERLVLGGTAEDRAVRNGKKWGENEL
ncbi:hypothetical protein IFU40_02085 [Microbacterium sp. CFBP 13617]|uniref:alpha/beta hydrolase n=1 Tax=Microbacterium sp. CFBP 13617 TaxID=2774035 RepID=UPI001782A300|nr:alpha/beta hydrolase [Microbacterium sp. CFBP 13617]MBD8217417.1 hypothetical protein [Microbacterium sp. CFBP 13617]